MRDTVELDGLAATNPTDGLEVVVARDAARLESIDAGGLAALGRRATTFGVIEPALAGLLETALARHDDPSRGPSRITLIAAPREAPLDDQRRDDDILSFLATGDLLDRIAPCGRPVETWCYDVMRSIMSGTRLTVDIQVVHKPGPRPEPPAPTASFDVVIPHRGLERHLRLCADSIARQDVKSSVWVAIDQKARCARFLNDIRGDASVSAYHLTPNPVGPYVARHHLGWAGRGDYLVWQDSDDISLASRLAMLSDEARAHNAGLVGSHELRIHEVQEKVLAVRYPLDASAGLSRIGAAHQVLFPTTLVRRDVFEAVGGFSTNRIFSLDVNFWLAVSLHATLRNVDEFLYVRRRRPGSLTMRKDIGSYSAIRKHLRDVRTADYLAVRAGRLDVQASALAIRHRAKPAAFRLLTAPSV